MTAILTGGPADGVQVRVARHPDTIVLVRFAAAGEYLRVPATSGDDPQLAVYRWVPTMG